MFRSLILHINLSPRFPFASSRIPDSRFLEKVLNLLYLEIPLRSSFIGLFCVPFSLRLLVEAYHSPNLSSHLWIRFCPSTHARSRGSGSSVSQKGGYRLPAPLEAPPQQDIKQYSFLVHLKPF